MDPYAKICQSLNRARVRYVVVGVFGINLYAEEAGVVMTTADCDIILPPDVATLARTLSILRKSRFSMEAGHEPLPNEDRVVLTGIVRSRSVVRASRPPTRVDLTLQISGYSFDQLWRERRRFRLQGVVVKVAPLAAMVRSKELANRPKDRLFLETFRVELKEMLARERRASRRHKK